MSMSLWQRKDRVLDYLEQNARGNRFYQNILAYYRWKGDITVAQVEAVERDMKW